ncbi:MAG TPA: hypothetical protein VFV49_14695, partial [Thermoanaerobaculia bacterium]|nr:hypothetical protein [Thermoanaerobaculia bacterium]
MRRWISILAMLLAAFTLSAADDLTVQHVMGTTGGFSFRTGTGTDARIGWVSWMARAADGSIYVPGSTAIWKISPTGELGMFAGHLSQTGNVNGDKWAARFWYLSGAAVDATGNLYVGDTSNFAIRKITPAGVVSTLGNTTGRPVGLAVDAAGNIFVSTESHLIQKFTPAGTRTNFAGSTTSGSLDGTGAAARFNFPKGLVFDSSGNLFVADGTNHLIRKITPAGVVTTFAGVAGQQGVIDGTGTAARMSWPWSIVIDGSNNLYVTNSPSHVRKITPAGVVTTITPNPSYGYRDGPVSQMRMHTPLGLVYDPVNNALVIGDAENSCIRKITLNDMMASTFIGLGVPDHDGAVDGQGLSARLRPDIMTAAPDGYVYFRDGATIRRFDADYNVSTYAGQIGAYSVVDGPLSAARFEAVDQIAADSAGNLYVPEGIQHVIRKITAAGMVSTIAGTAGVSGTSPGTGASATFDGPRAITCDSLGNVYVAHNTIISKITPAGVVTTFAGAPNSWTTPVVDGTGPAARFYFPRQLWTDPNDNIWMNDNGRIRKITPGAVVTSEWCCTGQGDSYAFNSAGDLYITSNYEIFKKAAGSSTVTTVMHNISSGATDGTTPNASLVREPNLVFAHGDRFYIGEPGNGSIRRGYFALADTATIDITNGPINTPRNLGVNGTEATSYEWSVVIRPYGSTAQIVSPSSSSASFTPDAEGWYRLQLVASNGTQIRYSQVDTFATCAPPAPPTITQIAGTNPSCPSTTVQLRASAGYSSYLWSNGLTGQTITVGSTQATYTVIGYSAPNCPSAPSQPWVQQVYPALTAVSMSLNGSATACAGGTGGTFTVTDTGGANNTHTWEYATTPNGIANVIAGQTGTTYTLTASHFPGPGSYYLSVRSRSSCTPTSFIRSNEIVVTISANPAATITASGPTTFCEGGSVTLTANAGSGYTYLWSPGDATTQSIAAMAGGSYTVTVTTPSGCSTTSSPTSVIVHPAATTPTISVSQNFYDTGRVATEGSGVSSESTYEFCEPANVRLTSSLASSYLWSTGATTRFIDVTATGAYTVTTTDANGCSASATVQIDIKPRPPQPTITASGSLQLCPGGNVTLTASAGEAWIWSNGATTQSITVSEAGSYSVRTIADGCSSIGSAVQYVSFRSAEITAGGPTQFCDGGSVTLTAGAADSWLWSNGATTQSINVTTGGTYQVTQSWNDGCSIAASPVSVTTGISAVSVTADNASICPGGTIRFTANATGGSGLTYQWSLANAQHYGPVAGATGPTFDLVQPASSGSVWVEVTDALGCELTSSSASYTVHPTPNPDVYGMPGTTLCPNDSVTLNAAPGFSSYLWSDGSTQSYLVVTQPGSYTVTVTGAGGCTASQTVAVTTAELAQPVVTAGGPTTFCEGGSVTLTAPSGWSYLWNNGATTQSITVAQSGAYHFTISNNTCSATSADTVVTVNANPTAPVISGPTSFCEGGSVTLTAPSGYASYAWSNGATTQSITVSASGTYNVTVSN